MGGEGSGPFILDAAGECHDEMQLQLMLRSAPQPRPPDEVAAARIPLPHSGADVRGDAARPPIIQLAAGLRAAYT